MNLLQAKETLLLYRPGTTDPNDAEFVEALSVAKRDPELEKWFHEHCEVQEALRSKFRQIAVPEGLKEQIISERLAYVAPPAPRIKRAVALAAVCIVLLAGLAVWVLQPREDKTFANFQARMVSTVARAYPKMDLETSDAKKIRETLAQKGGPANYVLPETLQKVPMTGCASLEWQGKPVSMLCFNSGKSIEPDLFLFIINRSNAPKAPATAKPQFVQRNRFATASWSDGQEVYLLAGRGDETFLRGYF